jgi:hypothetical protein
MLCLACGAAMQLREVALADIPTMPGFERHTYSCSACSQVASRLVICRAKMPVVDPLFPSTAPDAPAQKRSDAGGWKHIAECGREAPQRTDLSREKGGHRLEANGRGAHQGPQRASSGIEGLGVGEDGREAPLQTDGAQGASSDWNIPASDSEFARSAACRER